MISSGGENGISVSVYIVRPCHIEEIIHQNEPKFEQKPINMDHEGLA